MNGVEFAALADAPALQCQADRCACHRPGRNVMRHCPVPGHSDSIPSLSITTRDGKVLVRCHGGCEQQGLIAALQHRNLWPERRATSAQRAGRLQAVYHYLDEHGVLLYEVLRFAGKQFSARRPGEGEADADALVASGLIATTNSGGAGRWLPEFASYFKGAAQAVVLPDNDLAGAAHAEAVAASLSGAASEVKILPLPGLAEHGDVRDWLRAGHTREELLALVEAAPVWRPRSEEAAVTSRARDESGRAVVLSVASGVRPEPVRWAWEGRVPFGSLTLIAGMPGTGRRPP